VFIRYNDSWINILEIVMMRYNDAISSLSINSLGEVCRVDGEDLNLNISSGYLYLNIKGQNIAIHTAKYWLINGYTDKEIDHKDRNRLNNSIKNLRAVSRADNCKNVGIPITNTSGFKGVTWNKRAGKWHAQIRSDKKRYYLGLFDDIKDAAEAHDKKCHELHGEYAVTNKMLGRL